MTWHNIGASRGSFPLGHSPLLETTSSPGTSGAFFRARFVGSGESFFRASNRPFRDGHHSGPGHAGGTFLCAVERWRGSMRGEMINEYQKLNSEDQKTFRRWLWANTVVGAILLAGLIALASRSPSDEVATAQLAGMRTQAKLPLERASVLPSR